MNPFKLSVSKYFFVVFVFFILTFHFFTSYDLLTKSRILRTHDELNKLTETLHISNLNYTDISKEYLRFGCQSHPKFFTVTGAVIWKLLKKAGIFSDENLKILMPNSFFFCLLLISVYGITKSLSNDKTLAFLNVFLVSFTPYIFSLFRVYMADFPLTSMVSLSIYILIKTRNFNSSFYSILLGIILIFSGLTKETFYIFALPVLIFYIAYSFRTGKIKLINLITAVTPFIAFSLYFYFFSPQAFQSWERYRAVSSFLNSGMTLYYVYSAIFVYFYPIVFIPLMSLGLYYLLSFFRRERISAGLILLLVWIVFPYIIFSFSPNKDPRFLSPLIIPFLIISTMGLKTFPLFFRRLAYTFLIGIFFLQFLIFTYSPNFSGYYSSIKNAQNRYGFFPSNYNNWVYGVPVRKNDYPDVLYSAYSNVLRILKNDFCLENKKEPQVLVFITNPLICESLRREFEQKLKGKIMIPFGGDCADFYLFWENVNKYSFFKSTDYVVDINFEEKILFLGCPKVKVEKQFKETKNIFAQLRDRYYRLIGRVTLNKEKSILIYKKVKDING